jgi:hypothetical protein
VSEVVQSQNDKNTNATPEQVCEIQSSSVKGVMGRIRRSQGPRNRRWRLAVNVCKISQISSTYLAGDRFTENMKEGTRSRVGEGAGH